jgi:hypothetical protein
LPPPPFRKQIEVKATIRLGEEDDDDDEEIVFGRFDETVIISAPLPSKKDIDSAEAFSPSGSLAPKANGSPKKDQARKSGDGGSRAGGGGKRSSGSGGNGDRKGNGTKRSPSVFSRTKKGGLASKPAK